MSSIYQYHLIYKTINVVNKKYYIGKHSTDDVNDGYMGSGVVLNRAIKKYGKENFKREIIFIFNDEKIALAKEKEMVTHTFCRLDETYNLKEGGLGGSPLEETRYKISKTLKNRTLTEEHRKNMSLAQKKLYKSGIYSSK